MVDIVCGFVGSFSWGSGVVERAFLDYFTTADRVDDVRPVQEGAENGRENAEAEGIAQLSRDPLRVRERTEGEDKR